jgi:MoaA/NifB/PqqE/SkfB family radical SAM enzyme
MIKTTAIDLVNPEPMMVTWDIGRRCNYDCSYCEITRHDNVSPHRSTNELIETFAFIKQWTEMYNSQRAIGSTTNINFTGGEPTVNPNFWDLVDYIKTQDGFNLSLTTNGAWSPKFTEKIKQRFSGVTVSYHAEAHKNLKAQVLKNIYDLQKTGMWLQVNVMLHVDYWDECVNVYNELIANGISAKPRPIGDGNVARKGWFIDQDGSNRRTSHEYTTEQQEWFWSATGLTKKSTGTSEGESLGRGCCGGRCLVGKVEETWQEVKIVDTNFKDWSCMVDWYFLHIDQQTGLVYHHQTCQALHNNKRGALGHLNDTAQMVNDLAQRLKDPKPIICPNQRCGCGMCVPKAESAEEFNIIWKKNLKLQDTREISEQSL